MPEFPDRPTADHCTAFDGVRRIAAGPLVDVALAMKAALAAGAAGPVLAFDDATGAVVDIDLRGGDAEIAARLAPAAQEPAAQAMDEPAAPRGRGRPRLGVVSREVTLLPRHWDWLAAQPGGASAALRRLVDGARRAEPPGAAAARRRRDAAYRFMSAMAGDLPGFEEAARALFAGATDSLAAGRLAAEMAGWPPDIAAHVRRLASPEESPPARH